MKTETLSAKDKHKVKMQTKKAVREHKYNALRHSPEYIAANLGRNHPDYGMSMKEHEAEKALRNSQKSS